MSKKKESPFFHVAVLVFVFALLIGITHFRYSLHLKDQPESKLSFIEFMILYGD
jgi:hypothetical protein